MFYIIFVLLLFLLIVAVLLQRKEDEKWLWVKILIIYLCCFVSFSIQAIKIPILIIIGYFIIKNKSKVNVNIKLLALTFSLVLFITSYIVPRASLLQAYDYVKLENKFSRIDSYHYYPEESELQNKLRRYNTDDERVMFTVWVYDYNNIAIKDYDWLLSSFDELDVYWLAYHRTSSGYSEVYIRFNKTGQEYFGILRRDKNGKEYLESVVEGEFKPDGYPRYPMK